MNIKSTYPLLYLKNCIQMKKILILLLLVAQGFFACTRAQMQGKYVEVDTLTMRVDTADYCFTVYTPKAGAQFTFVRTRPDTLDTRTGLSVVAAFTSKKPEHIVGTNVCQGDIRSDSTESETGYCLIVNGRVEIRPLDNGREQSLSRAVNAKGDYFQQMLLVYDSKPVPTTVFRNRTTARRALVQTKSETFLVATDDRIHIDTFTDCLIRMGAIRAIYLDMGSWSEGWYRTEEGSVQKIGTNYRSSHLQTNWLTVQAK